MKTSWAILTLTVLASTRLAAAESVAPSGAVACISTTSMLHYADAAESGDRAKLKRLLNGECRMLEGKPYALLEEHNGTVKIAVFRKSNDWETAEVFYTLEEMLQLE